MDADALAATLSNMSMTNDEAEERIHIRQERIRSERLARMRALEWEIECLVGRREGVRWLLMREGEQSGCWGGGEGLEMEMEMEMEMDVGEEDEEGERGGGGGEEEEEEEEEEEILPVLRYGY